MLKRTVILLIVLSAVGRGEEMIRAGRFMSDVQGWSFYVNRDQAKAEVTWEARKPDGCALVRVERSAAFHNVQFWAAPLATKKGQTYTVSFEARGERPTQVRVSLMRNAAPWRALGLTATLALSPEWKTYTLLGKASEDSEDARLDFMPLGTVWLDNVTMQPSAPPQNAAIGSHVRLGPGWRGEPQAVADGKPNTALGMRGHPDLPLVMELTLPAATPVVAVNVEGVERGRHQKLGELAIDVSADGQRWFLFGKPAREAASPKPGETLVQYAATNVACTVKHVRVRVLSVGNSAQVREVEVLRVAGEAAAGPETLPPVPLFATACFRGWDYARLGYAASPSESVALRFSNQGFQPITGEVRWRLADYAGATLRSGSGKLDLAAGAMGEAPIRLPAELPDGHYRVHYELVGADEAESKGSFYFDYRAPSGPAEQRLRIISLLDNNDPEGYVAMLLGSIRTRCEIVQALPEKPAPDDVALLMCERLPEGSDLPAQLARFVDAGGRVLAFGKVSPAFGDLLPVTIPEKPFVDAPQTLRLRDERHPLLKGLPLPPQYALAVQAKAGARVLAEWGNGSPAVVEDARSRVLYFAGAPGRCWRQGSQVDEFTVRALYHLAGKPGAASAVLAEAERDANAKAAEARGRVLPENFGRFGWRVNEGLLAANVAADGNIRLGDVSGRDVRLAFGADAKDLVPQVTRLNWLSKQVAWKSGDREAHRVSMSLGTPGILYEGQAKEVRVEASWAKYVAWQAASGVQTAELKPGEVAQPAAGASSLALRPMAANWLLFWRGDSDADAPFLLVLTRRPQRLRIGDTLTLEFSDGFGAVVFSHLWGLRRPAAAETANWKQGFPADVQSQVAFWSRALLAHPVECRETFRARPRPSRGEAGVDGNTVRISDEFRYQTLTDAWGTEAMKLAPIPPVLALLTQPAAGASSLALRHGFPSRVEPAVTATGYATTGGPLACARGDRVAYDLTLPCTDHFGLVATADPLPLQAEIDQMAEVGLKSTQFASGGYTSHTAFHDDMRLYDSSSGKTFDAPCIDLYKWLYCFPMLTGQPLYSPELRQRVDAHHRLHYWQTVNFYPHKCFVQWRREPWTGTDYVISFVWAVMFQDGVRWFVDQNESAAVILYCLWAYSQYHGDWLTAQSNWPLYRQMHDYLAKVHDWAFMASSNQEFFRTVGIDMLNSEYPGNLAAARVARQAGDADYADRCLYLAAKSMAPILARLYMRDYVATICPPDHPWREWKYFPSLHDGVLGGDKDMLMRGGTESVLALALDFYDTSKGTSPEVELLYKHYAAPRIAAYEADVQALADEHKEFPGWAHLMMRALLGQDSNRLMDLARGFCRTHVNWGWQTTKGPHNLGVVCLAPRRFVLTDWAPAEYLGGTLAPNGSSVTLRFRSEAKFQCVFSSGRLAESVAVNGRPIEAAAWTSDPQTGRVSVPLPAGRDVAVEVHFGSRVPARLHPYFTR